IAGGVVAVGAALWLQLRATPAGQTATGTATRTAGSKTDLNGIWQAINTANYDLQAHAARPALALLSPSQRSGVPGLVRATHVELPAVPVRAFGATGGVPGGDSVVEGDEIPYQPWAAAKKREN